MFDVVIKKRTLEGLAELPPRIQDRLRLLLEDLRDKGPVRGNWQNFSKLGETDYHCHLAYRYVACWTYDKQERKIEVYYVGSRKDAPY